MVTCRKCGEAQAAEIFALCPDCLKNQETETLLDFHKGVRKRLGLPPRPPRTAGAVKCNLCSNACSPAPGEPGYCGLRENRGGRLQRRVPEGKALAYIYTDPLPTNCCAAWFCPGSRERGSNLAVFFYGCNFDCLFCQNASHKLIDQAEVISEEELVGAALKPGIRCVCFFGGSPEPQLDFALKAAAGIVKKAGQKVHICWEWNGCGNPDLAGRAAELSEQSGGTVKFDLKAYTPALRLALCGVDTSQAFINFRTLAERYPHRPDLLTATTLLVPFYLDAREVEAIASFIAAANPDIPYQLLVFHPDFYLRDLPVTPRRQVQECHEAARRHLSRVSIGNRHLLDAFY